MVGDGMVHNLKANIVHVPLMLPTIFCTPMHGHTTILVYVLTLKIAHQSSHMPFFECYNFHSHPPSGPVHSSLKHTMTTPTNLFG